MLFGHADTSLGWLPLFRVQGYMLRILVVRSKRRHRNGNFAEAEALPMMDQLEKWIKDNPLTSADLHGVERPGQENRLSRELYKKHFS